MLIDQVLREVVAETSTLRERLIIEAKENGMLEAEIASLLAVVPAQLLDAGAFLDELTRLWRYEFGIPFNIGNSHYWGTHMWVPVGHLFIALHCARTRLSDTQFNDYVARLCNPEKHHATLVEMIPAQKVDSNVPLEFEVAGLGAGNRTVDWVVHPGHGPFVLLDVKNRTADFIKQAEQMAADPSAQVPIHNPALLFRSIEEKFLPSDPDVQLQGAWICTHIQQDEQLLEMSFSALSSDKVHFAILGDWESDAHVLARRPEDQLLLLDLFRLQPSTRFTFRGSAS